MLHLPLSVLFVRSPVAGDGAAAAGVIPATRAARFWSLYFGPSDLDPTDLGSIKPRAFVFIEIGRLALAIRVKQYEPISKRRVADLISYFTRIF